MFVTYFHHIFRRSCEVERNLFDILVMTSILRHSVAKIYSVKPSFLQKQERFCSCLVKYGRQYWRWWSDKTSIMADWKNTDMGHSWQPTVAEELNELLCVVKNGHYCAPSTEHVLTRTDSSLVPASLWHLNSAKVTFVLAMAWIFRLEATKTDSQDTFNK